MRGALIGIGIYLAIGVVMGAIARFRERMTDPADLAISVGLWPALVVAMAAIRIFEGKSG